MSALIDNPAALILAVLTIVATLFYLREYNLRVRSQRHSEKILEEFRKKGWETLHQSIKKSQEILGTAELEGVKMAADTRFSTAKLEDQLSLELQEMIKHSEETIKLTQDQFSQYIRQLEVKSAQFETTQAESTQQRISQMFERLEQRLADFLVKTEASTTTSIELELRSARQLIDTYKQQQLALIDENIIAMIEQTLNLVLGKKLSLKEQLDLVYEALEKAKIEKFIV